MMEYANASLCHVSTKPVPIPTSSAHPAMLATTHYELSCAPGSAAATAADRAQRNAASAHEIVPQHTATPRAHHTKETQTDTHTHTYTPARLARNHERGHHSHMHTRNLGRASHHRHAAETRKSERRTQHTLLHAANINIIVCCCCCCLDALSTIIGRGARCRCCCCCC